MAKQSLFSACKRVFRDGISGTYTVGNNDIFLELYGQQDIDQNNEIGNSSEENIVVVAGDTITIPEGCTLTPVKPKKSLVVICNKLVNNGTISMYQKAPNVLPHDLFIIEKNDFGGRSDVIIPAYANNQVSETSPYASDNLKATDGNNGTNRNCGSGGIGSGWWRDNVPVASGSGYAFGGGAGSSGYGGGYSGTGPGSVDATYPMRGANAISAIANCLQGGVGNPAGASYGYQSATLSQNFGCGGRIIIFCVNFINNGIINVNGTSAKRTIADGDDIYNIGWGGASGAGAVDLFYTNIATQGTITASGGENILYIAKGPRYLTSGKGGNGSITLTPWVKTSIIKPIEKYMSKKNMVYFLTNYIQRLKQGED